jgi:hypothetical protein
MSQRPSTLLGLPLWVCGMDRIIRTFIKELHLKELLHQFGLFENRVRVGLCEILLSKHSNGVVLGTNHQTQRREYVWFVVDKLGKLANPNEPMVCDMVAQFDKLGIEAELIELHSRQTAFTYRVTGDKQVEFVAQAPRFAH